MPLAPLRLVVAAAAVERGRSRCRRRAGRRRLRRRGRRSRGRRGSCRRRGRRRSCRCRCGPPLIGRCRRRRRSRRWRLCRRSCRCRRCRRSSRACRRSLPPRRWPASGEQQRAAPQAQSSGGEDSGRGCVAGVHRPSSALHIGPSSVAKHVQSCVRHASRRPPRVTLGDRAAGQIRSLRDAGRHLRTQLLLGGLRRPAEARPQDGDDPARRQEQQVRARPGRLDHGRLPPQPAREDLHRGDRRRRGEAASASSRARDIEHDNPEFRRLEDEIKFLEQIYSRPVADDDIGHRDPLLADRRAAAARTSATGRPRTTTERLAPSGRVRLPHHLAAGVAARAGLGGDLRPGALARVVARGRGGRGAAARATTAASARVSRMVWKSLLPYRVEFEVTTTRVERPHLLEATRSAS